MQEVQSIEPTEKGAGAHLADIDYLQVEKSSLIIRALNNKRRQSILKMLEREGPLTVTQIYIMFRLEQSLISQHLAILRRAGVVRTERDGKNMFYHLNDGRLVEISGFVGCLLENA